MGIYILVFAMMLILAIMGISSAVGAYAQAEQARATIAVAQVAQINAWGNLLVIIVVFVVCLLVLALIAGGLWLVWKREMAKVQSAAKVQQTQGRGGGMSLSDLVALEMLRQMRSQGQNQPQLMAPPQDETVDVTDWMEAWR